MAMYLKRLYRGTSVSCRYSVPHKVEYAELKRTILQAIARTILSQPVMQVAIKGAATKKPSWIKLDSLDLDHHVAWHILDAGTFEQTFQETVASQLDSEYPDLEKRPSWRVTIMYEQDPQFLEILFTWNHPLGDGMSGRKFHEHLLEHLNSPNANNDGSLLSASKLQLPTADPNLPPRIEKLAKLPLTPRHVFKTVLKEHGPAVLTKDDTEAHWAPIQTSSYKSHIRVFSIGKEILSSILAACRQNNTTLTGLFHALGILFLASRLDTNSAPGFHTKTAVDLRRFLPSSPKRYPWLHPQRTMGNYVSVMGHAWPASLVSEIRVKLSADPSTETLSADLLKAIWSISAQAHRQIRHKLDMNLKDDIVGIMKFVPDWRKQVMDAARRPREYSYFISNIGAIDGGLQTDATASEPQSEKWTITRAQFSMSAEVTSAPLMTSAMSVLGGPLCVGITWQDGVLDDSMGEAFAAELESWLIQIGRVSA
ncbi:hypothetical protein PFICI_12368 [Pestalotiopsis fici W106-1]|uniref:Diacylglycerol O-acyltransferase n=1 Tax=Pestalotiopsis fici (strain W106-1 / CGMCC3.15140) TaxID=1229662 RepID=W3WNQ2_PESFW|nr:uncharacterized protein PFICI_12368 [Pestalotiopsis fici W106-1]ETS75424.1 hypothetical protein PFICI_12368 [Pestalotiopsis fici W106-1]